MTGNLGRVRVAVIVWLALSAAPAFASSLANDGFGDGDRNNDGTLDLAAGLTVQDPQDRGVPFWAKSTNQSQAVVDDSGALGSGLALQVVPNDQSSAAIVSHYAATTLNDGDTITLSFDARIDKPPTVGDATTDRRFRFGLYSSNSDGGHDYQMHHDGDSSATTVDNWSGFMGQVDVGPAYTTVFGLKQNNSKVNGGGLLGGSGVTFATSADSAAALSDAGKRHFTISVSRSGEAVTVSGSVDGVEISGGTQDATGGTLGPISFVFDSLAIGFGSFKDSDFLIDNVSVTHKAANENEPPIASLAASPSSGDPPLTVDFDASASSDPDGSIVSYSFDFGDGSAPLVQASPAASYTYANAGSFNASVTVTDDRGATAQHSLTIAVGNVAPPPNQAPTASFSANPASGVAPLAVSFDASASTDPDGSIVDYVFDFGDGSARLSQSAPTASHTYAKEGAYLATLIVTDDGGATAQQALLVNVQRAPVSAPVPVLGVSPSVVKLGQIVSFFGGGSYSPDQRAVKNYTFNFGDASAPQTQPTPTAPHTYKRKGTYIASLTVADDAGNSSAVAAQVVVTVNDDDGGGAFGWLTLLPLAVLAAWRRRP